jgi:hypothetical protein
MLQRGYQALADGQRHAADTGIHDGILPRVLRRMTVLWLIVLTVGLLLSVRVMIAGVASTEDATGGPAHRPTSRMFLPLFAAFCTVSGLVGYLMTHFAHLDGVWPFVAAIGAAAIAMLIVRLLVRWSASAAGPDPEDDPRFRFQGHVARVVEAIAPERPGRIVFQTVSGQLDLRATALDGATVALGAEVVIERIDDDVAIVEPWARVEERL